MNIQAFNDPNGKTSSSRILYVVGMCIFMLTWAGLSIKNGYMVAIDTDTLAILGILSGQRAIQSFAEHKATPESKETPE